MVSRHWNPKTGRGRWNNNVQRSPSPTTAKRIVRKAGPMDRRLFTDTDRTDALFLPRTWIPAAGANGQDDISLFTPADYDELALSHREKIRISTLEMRSIWSRLGVTENDHASETSVMWWVYIATAADFQAITAGGITPWSSTTSSDYAQFSKIRTLKRGRFKLASATLATLVNNGTWANSRSVSYKDLYIRFRKKLWLTENEQLCFSYRWWHVLQDGTSPGVPAVSGNLDTLIRWQRY